MLNERKVNDFRDYDNKGDNYQECTHHVSHSHHRQCSLCLLQHRPSCLFDNALSASFDMSFWTSSRCTGPLLSAVRILSRS